LISVGTIIIEAAPRFAIFEAWEPRTVGIRGLAERRLSLHAGPQAVETNEQEVEVVVPTFRKARKVGQPQS